MEYKEKKEFLEMLETLSEKELWELSLEKNSKGNATEKALYAQRKIWEDAGYPFQSETHREREHTPVR